MNEETRHIVNWSDVGCVTVLIVLMLCFTSCEVTRMVLDYQRDIHGLEARDGE